MPTVEDKPTILSNDSFPHIWILRWIKQKRGERERETKNLNEKEVQVSENKVKYDLSN